MRDLTADVVLIDGEIVAVDKRGRPSFQMLQNRASLGRHWQIVYYAFDLLELEGKDWKTRPLTERKEQLQQVVSASQVRYNAEPARLGRGGHAHRKAGRIGRRDREKAQFNLPSQHSKQQLAEA